MRISPTQFPVPNNTQPYLSLLTLTALLATFYFSYEADLQQPIILLHGADFAKSLFFCYNYLQGVRCWPVFKPVPSLSTISSKFQPLLAVWKRFAALAGKSGISCFILLFLELLCIKPLRLEKSSSYGIIGRDKLEWSSLEIKRASLIGEKDESILCLYIFQGIRIEFCPSV